MMRAPGPQKPEGIKAPSPTPDPSPRRQSKMGWAEGEERALMRCRLLPSRLHQGPSGPDAKPNFLSSL
eukprot:83417-Pyramimonas_sp.AAC.2